MTPASTHCVDWQSIAAKALFTKWIFPWGSTRRSSWEYFQLRCHAHESLDRCAHDRIIDKLLGYNPTTHWQMIDYYVDRL